MKFNKLNIAVIVLVSLFLAFYLCAVDGAQSVVNALCSIKPSWLLVGVLLMAGYWLLEAVILHLGVKPFHKQQRFFSTLNTAMVGQFFNCVTPFASGGQPMQIYHMTKQGVPVGISTCALLVKFVVYQFVLTIYSLATLIFSFNEFSVHIPRLKYLVLVGFGVNAAVICGLLCICFFKKQTNRLVSACIRLLAKAHLVKDEQKLQESARDSITQFYEGFLVLRHDVALLLRMAALSVLQLTLYFMIPFALYCAFGLSGASFFTMLSAQAFVLNISSFVPLPGAAGGAELSFSAMFAMFFPEAVLNVVIMLWRLLTFYMPILVGTFFVIKRTKKNKAPAVESPNVA